MSVRDERAAGEINADEPGYGDANRGDQRMVEHPHSAAELLGRIAGTAAALAQHWPAATADRTLARDVCWCASMLAEQVVALLRDGHQSKAVEKADLIGDVAASAVHRTGLVEAGSVAVCALCGEDYEPAEAPVCGEDRS
jgi:hypothetical protein